MLLKTLSSMKKFLTFIFMKWNIFFGANSRWWKISFECNLIINRSRITWRGSSMLDLILIDMKMNRVVKEQIKFRMWEQYLCFFSGNGDYITKFFGQKWCLLVSQPLWKWFLISLSCELCVNNRTKDVLGICQETFLYKVSRWFKKQWHFLNCLVKVKIPHIAQTPAKSFLIRLKFFIYILIFINNIFLQGFC